MHTLTNLFCILRSAPQSHSRVTTSGWPLSAARIRAEDPSYSMTNNKFSTTRIHKCIHTYIHALTSSVCTLTSAPRSHKKVTTSECPALAAVIRAVALTYHRVRVSKVICEKLYLKLTLFLLSIAAPFSRSSCTFPR